MPFVVESLGPPPIGAGVAPVEFPFFDPNLGVLREARVLIAGQATLDGIVAPQPQVEPWTVQVDHRLDTPPFEMLPGTIMFNGATPVNLPAAAIAVEPFRVEAKMDEFTGSTPFVDSSGYTIPPTAVGSLDSVTSSFNGFIPGTWEQNHRALASDIFDSLSVRTTGQMSVEYEYDPFLDRRSFGVGAVASGPPGLSESNGEAGSDPVTASSSTSFTDIVHPQDLAGTQLTEDDLGKTQATWSTQSSSNAGPQSLGASASATMSTTLPPILARQDGEGRASADLFYSDLIVVGPAPDLDDLPVSLNLSFGGSLSANVSGDGGATALVRVELRVADHRADGAYRIRVDSNGVETLKTGLLAGLDDPDSFPSPEFPPNAQAEFDQMLETDQFLVPVNRAFDLSLDISVLANALSSSISEGSASASVNFGNSFGFPLGQPVLNLPPGYTLYSAQADIVDNQLIPEPHALVLLIAAPSMHLLRRRREQANGSVSCPP